MRGKLTCITGWLFVMAATSCQPDEFSLTKPDADQFVAMLKDGSYAEKFGYQLPDFSMAQIDRLMHYVNDTTAITMFPGNPISSKHTDPKILNECLMWTIDGIRFGVKYPSLEAVLVDTLRYSESTGYARFSGKELQVVSGWYTTWHEEYKQNASEVLKKKDLFEQTSYRWN